MMKEEKIMNIKTSIVTVTAVAAMAFAGVAGTLASASAQEPGTATPPAQTAPKQKRQEKRDDFLGRVAGRLNVSLDQLKQAFKDAGIDTVNQALADGKITQDQANKMIDRINNGQGLGLARFFRDRRADRLQRLRAGIVRSSATALNMTPQDLRARLKAGDSIATVAASRNVSLDAVKTQITGDAKAKLDQIVANGKLTADQETNLLQKLSDGLDKILNKSRTPAPSPTP